MKAPVISCIRRSTQSAQLKLFTHAQIKTTINVKRKLVIVIVGYFTSATIFRNTTTILISNKQ